MECWDYRQYLKKHNKVFPIKKQDCTIKKIKEPKKIQTYQLAQESPKFIQQVNNDEKNKYQMI